MGTGAIGFSGRGSAEEARAAVRQAQPDVLDLRRLRSPSVPDKKVLDAHLGGRRPSRCPTGTTWGSTAGPPIYIPYPQAVPNKAVIDPAACLHLIQRRVRDLRGSLRGQGHRLRPAEQETLELDVGAVILVAGLRALRRRPEAASSATAATPTCSRSLEFERILSASGPTVGEVVRPSDDAHAQAHRLHPVRGLARPGARLLLLRLLHVRHQAGDDRQGAPARTSSATSSSWTCAPIGKGFDAYYQRALDDGVRFVRSRPSSIKEDPLQQEPLHQYLEDEAGEFMTAEYDLVVLSRRPRAGARGAGGRRRARHRPEPARLLPARASSSRSRPAAPGVFVCGPVHRAQGHPRDGDAGVGRRRLGHDPAGRLARHADRPRRSTRTEKDVTGEEPRIGVFVCHCGTNIGGVVDVPERGRVRPQAARRRVRRRQPLHLLDRQPGADPRDDRRSTTSTASWWPPARRAPTSRSSGTPSARRGSTRTSSRWPTSATSAPGCTCTSPRRRPRRPRTWCAWPWPRPACSSRSTRSDVPLTHAALVIGGGVAGMTAALALGDEGLEVHLVERSPELGGHVLELDNTIQRQRPRGLPRASSSSASIDNPNVRIHLEAELADFHGFIGNFSSVIARPTVSARRSSTAWSSWPPARARSRPELYGLGASPKVVTQHGPRAHAGRGRRPRARRGQVGRHDPLRRLARREQALLLAHLLPAEHQERHPRSRSRTPTGPCTSGTRTSAPSASSRSTTPGRASWASSSRATTTTPRRR